MNESLGVKLRLLRHSLNLSQNTVSKSTGLKVETIRKYENDKILNPRNSTLAKLAAYYGVSVSTLINLKKAPLK